MTICVMSGGAGGYYDHILVFASYCLLPLGRLRIHVYESLTVVNVGK